MALIGTNCILIGYILRDKRPQTSIPVPTPAPAPDKDDHLVLKPKEPPLSPEMEKLKKRIEDEQVAFEEILGYNADIAYGINNKEAGGKA